MSNRRKHVTLVAEKVRDFMEVGHLSQARMAARVGISQGALSRILSGETQRLRHSTIDQIAASLGISVQELLDPKLAMSQDSCPAKNAPSFDVFLAYSNRDKASVRKLATILAKQRIRVWFDENQLIPGRAWQPLLEQGIRESTACAVFVGKDGLGPWEDVEMAACLRHAITHKKPVIPILLPGAPEKVPLPQFLANRTWVDMREGFGKEKLAVLIWGITGKEHRLESVRPTESLEIAPTSLRHGADRFVGRQKELARLDAAWHDPKTHIVTIVAWGGVGKTALVVDWMTRMAADGWRGAERVFDWSFYSQGTSETAPPASDAFVAKALEFFGDPEMAKSAASPWDKGERLARLVAERKTLLVLDGVEPLQYPPGPVGGKLKDPALEVLLKGLARQNQGLCLVTTRERLTNLTPWQETTSPKWDLEHLSDEAGAQLLFDSGVRRAGDGQIKADDKELKDAAREVGGHALTLRLLGNYLKLAHEGDVRKRDIVKLEEADPQFKTNPADADKSYGHAFKVMRMCQRWLSASGEDGKRQVALLQLLGLFDRPADGGCLAALRKEPVIDGLTEPLVGLTEAQWNTTISRLQECGIVTTHTGESKIVNRQSAIDSHPLVREYFGKQLRQNKPKAWKEAHWRLYEHLCKHKEGNQPTLEDLQPLYQAVAHGCLAGIHHRARSEVYIKRILRGTDGPHAFYSWNKLGAFGSDLAVLACFFERPWKTLPDGLTEATQAWLLNETAIHLRAVGRLTEALEPLQTSFELRVKQKNWRQVALHANNLSELELTLGEVARAVGDAEQCVTYADRSADAGMRMIMRTTHADALHQAGRRADAEELFREAEQMQKGGQPDYPLLYSLQGFRYCDLLLAAPERAVWEVILDPTSQIRNPKLIESCRHVEQRAKTMFDWRGPSDSLLDIALRHLTLGRAALYQAILANGPQGASHESLDAAVGGLRRAGQQDELPKGLLSRALLRFVEQDKGACGADLDEAWEIAERGSMKLYMADVLLHRARLFRDKAALEKAAKLIKGCGYHRRDEELADAQQAAKNW